MDFTIIDSFIGYILIIILAVFALRYRNWYVVVLLAVSIVSAAVGQNNHSALSAAFGALFQGLLTWLIYRYMVLAEFNRRMVIKAYLASIVEGTQLAVIGIDSDSKIVAWNKGAEHIYGWAAAEVIDKQITEVIVPPHRKDEALAHLRQAKEGQQVQIYQAPRTTKDGRNIIVENTVSPIYNADNKVVGASSISKLVKDNGYGKQ